MSQSRMSNLPFLERENGSRFTTTNKSHFRPFENGAVQKRNLILPPISKLLQQEDRIYQGMKNQTETESSFKSRPRPEANLPTLSHRIMQTTNFKMHSGNGRGRFETITTHADFKPFPMSAAKIIRPTTSVEIGRPGSKLPETTYSSNYTKQEVSSTRRAKETVNTGGVGSSLKWSNIREQADEKWTTSSSEEFRAHKYGPVHLVRRDRNLSSVFKGEILEGNRERPSTTKQCFLPKIDRPQCPEQVNRPGSSGIRTLSNVTFGRPDLAGCSYSTTSQEQFPSKQVERPKPHIFPPIKILREREPVQMISTIQKDFVPLNPRRPELNPSHLQRVKYSHIRPWHNKQDFRTTHNEVFVPKTCYKTSLDNPPLQHISHISF